MTAVALSLALLASVDLQSVDIVERLGETVPADIPFTDSNGEKVDLGLVTLGTRPVIVTFVYYRCPTLCPMMLGGLTGALNKTGLKLGEDYRVVTVSIDPSETPADAAKKRRGHLQALGRTENDPDWPFLVGDAKAIGRLGEAVGFKSQYDADLSQFAHAAGFVVLTPDGRVSRYMYGLEYPPRDLKLALVEASDGRVGTAFDRFLMTCYRYDPATRRYGFVMTGIIQGGGLLVFAALAIFLGIMWKRELKS